MSAFKENYEAPKSKSNYTRFQQGENKVRVLSEVITGFELWADKKPVRFKEWHEVDPPEGWDGKEARHFQAMVVWNRDLKCLQIMQVTQGSIQKKLASLDASSDWGDIRSYDIVITRTGEGLDTRYDTMPSPKSELEAEIKQAYTDASIKLEALYIVADPFESVTESPSDTTEKAKEDDLPF